MKKKIIYGILILLICTANSFAFSEKRQQWWELRLENLTAEREALKKNNNEIIDSILLKDIDTAKSVIKIFNIGMLGLEETNSGRKKVTDSDIEQLAGGYITAAFNIYYMKNILRFEEFNDINEQAKLVLHTYACSYLSRNFPNIDDIFTANFIKENELPYYRKYLALEIFLQEAIKQYEMQSSIARKNILMSIKNEIGQHDNWIYEYELREITNRNIVAYFSSPEKISSFAVSEKSMKQTWVINQLNLHFNRKIEQFKMVSQLLEYVPVDKNINKLDYYNRRPDVLEKISFQYFKSNLLNTDNYILADFSGNRNLEPDMLKLFSDIDSKKMNFASSINGFENNESFRNFEKTFTSSINAYFSRSNTFFNNNDKTYKNQYSAKSKEESSDSSMISSDHKPSENINFDEYLKKYFNEYYRSRTAYNNKLNAAKKYAKASLLYLQWLSSLKNISGKSIEESFNYRINKNREYADFMFLLSSDIACLAELENTEFTSTIHSTLPLLTNMISTLNQSLSIEARERQHLTTETITELDIRRGKEITQNNNSLKQAYADRQKYNSKLNELVSFRKKRDSEIRKKLAQFEINTLLESVNSYFDSFLVLNYSQDIFTSYLEKYSILENKCRNGIYSEELDDVLKQGSIFLTLKDYNEKKLQDEIDARKLLKQSIHRDIAKMKALLQYYNSQKIILTETPSLSELDRKARSLDVPVQVKISAWNMNENNFIEVDKKAVTSVRQIYLRTAWNVKPDNSNLELNKSPDITFSFSRHGMKITIPFGWESEKLTQKDINAGTIANFINTADMSEFRINIIKFSNTTQDSTDKWIKANGYSISQIGWEKIANREVYWSISKDKKYNVIKTYSFKKDGKIILVSGKSTKKMFPFFNRRFDNVIQSVIL